MTSWRCTYVYGDRRNGVVGEARECAEHPPERSFWAKPASAQSTRQNGVFGQSPRVRKAPARYQTKPPAGKGQGPAGCNAFLPITEKNKRTQKRTTKRTGTGTECRYTNTNTTTITTKHEGQKIVTGSHAMFRKKNIRT